MQVVYLLSHENYAVVLVSLILVDGLGRFLILLLNLIEDLLEFVEIEAAPNL